MISRQEVDRVAKSHQFHAPYNIDDMAVVARDLDARYMVFGEIKTAEIRMSSDGMNSFYTFVINGRIY